MLPASDPRSCFLFLLAEEEEQVEAHAHDLTPGVGGVTSGLILGHSAAPFLSALQTQAVPPLGSPGAQSRPLVEFLSLYVHYPCSVHLSINRC